MTHEAAMHASKMKVLAHQAEKMVNLIGLTRAEKRRYLLPFRASLNHSRATAEAVIGTSVISCPARPTIPRQVQIATEDWDILFRGIEARVSAAVAKKPGALLTLLTDEAVARNKVVVLECISDLQQLCTALEYEYQSRQQL